MSRRDEMKLWHIDCNYAICIVAAKNKKDALLVPRDDDCGEDICANPEEIKDSVDKDGKIWNVKLREAK
jgi:hypothetical protein